MLDNIYYYMIYYIIKGKRLTNKRLSTNPINDLSMSISQNFTTDLSVAQTCKQDKFIVGLDLFMGFVAEKNIDYHQTHLKAYRKPKTKAG